MVYEKMTLRSGKPKKKFNVSIKPRRSTPYANKQKEGGYWGNFRKGPIPYMSPSTPTPPIVEVKVPQIPKNNRNGTREPKDVEMHYVCPIVNPRVGRPVTPAQTSKSEKNKTTAIAVEVGIQKSEKKAIKRQRHAKLNMKNKQGKATMGGKSELLLQQIQMSME